MSPAGDANGKLETALERVRDRRTASETEGRQRGTATMTLLVAGALPAALPVEAGAQETAPEVSGHLFEPRPLPYTSAVQRRLRAPEGFTVRAWATGLGNPRIMAFAADGTLYVTRRDTGDVLALADRDGNGRAEFERVAVRGLNLVHGIAIGATACGSPPTPASTTRPSPGRGRSAPRGCFATTCPRPASTPTKTLAFGPDGKLYITAGSTCNNCREPNPEAATMLRSEPDGSARAVVATGCATRSASAGIRGRGGSGAGTTARTGAVTTSRPRSSTASSRAGTTAGPSASHPGASTAGSPRPAQPHEGAVLPRHAPPEPDLPGPLRAHRLRLLRLRPFRRGYRGDAFVAMRGSWNRRTATGYKVVRVHYDGAGRPVRASNFLTGFLRRDRRAQYGRPAGLLVAPDGALLLSEDTNGVIYRIARR